MRDAFLRLYDLYARILWGFAIVAGTATFVIMWLININAFSRKLLNAPLMGGTEMTQALLPVVIMLPFGYALCTRHHVSSVFLTSQLPPPLRRGLHVFWMFVGFLLFAAVTYGTFQYALRSYGMGEQVWGATMRFPIWPSKMAISLGTLLICIQFLFDAIRGILVDDSHELLASRGGEASLEQDGDGAAHG